MNLFFLLFLCLSCVSWAGQHTNALVSRQSIDILPGELWNDIAKKEDSVGSSVFYNLRFVDKGAYNAINPQDNQEIRKKIEEKVIKDIKESGMRVPRFLLSPRNLRTRELYEKLLKENFVLHCPTLFFNRFLIKSGSLFARPELLNRDPQFFFQEINDTFSLQCDQKSDPEAENFILYTAAKGGLNELLPGGYITGKGVVNLAPVPKKFISVVNYAIKNGIGKIVFPNLMIWSAADVNTIVECLDQSCQPNWCEKVVIEFQSTSFGSSSLLCCLLRIRSDNQISDSKRLELIKRLIKNKNVWYGFISNYNHKAILCSVTSSYLSGNKHSYDILELLINNSFTPFHILDELLKCCYDRDLFNDSQLKLWKSLVEKLKSRGAKTNIEEPKEFTLIRQNNKIKNLMKLSALVGILFPCSFALILAMKKKMECLKKSQNSTKIFD